MKESMGGLWRDGWVDDGGMDDEGMMGRGWRDA